jgi:hypothetical protein
MATLKSDLSSVPKYKFENYDGKDGIQYYRVQYSIEAIITDTDIKVQMDFEGIKVSFLPVDLEQLSPFRAYRFQREG